MNMILSCMVIFGFGCMWIGITYGVYMMIRDDRRSEKARKNK